MWQLQTGKYESAAGDVEILSNFMKNSHLVQLLNDMKVVKVRVSETEQKMQTSVC